MMVEIYFSFLRFFWFGFSNFSFFAAMLSIFFLKMNEFTIDIYRKILRLLFFITNWTELYIYIYIYKGLLNIRCQRITIE